MSKYVQFYSYLIKKESGRFTHDGEKLTSVCGVEQSQIEDVRNRLRDMEKAHTQVRERERYNGDTCYRDFLEEKRKQK